MVARRGSCNSAVCIGEWEEVVQDGSYTKGRQDWAYDKESIQFDDQQAEEQ